MSDDIFTKLDKATVESKTNPSAGVDLLKKLRKQGLKIDIVPGDHLTINGCIMWSPIDDTKELQ
jgi:hypothetical protein